MTRLNLGAGNTVLDGYVSVDKYDPAADVQADLIALPFDDNSVDEIVAYQVIEHIPYNDTEQAFKEMFRVLKPDGVLITECPDMEYWAHRIVLTGRIEDATRWNIWGQYYRPWDEPRYGKEEALHCRNAVHCHGFTFDDLRAFADQLGFSIVKLPMELKESKYEENLACRWVKLPSSSPVIGPLPSSSPSPEIVSLASRLMDDQTKSSSSTTAAPKKKLGRPKGSKNKRKSSRRRATAAMLVPPIEGWPKPPETS